MDDIQAMYAAGRAGGNTQSEQLGSLNNRFASYIEKVRYLEEQNKILELKIKQASKRKSEMEQNRDKDEEIKELRVQIDHATMVKVRDPRSTHRSAHRSVHLVGQMAKCSYEIPEIGQNASRKGQSQR